MSVAVVSARRLPVLTRTTAFALLASALAYASEMLELGPDLSVSIVVACVLAAAGLTATGWRWTPLLGAAIAAVIAVNNPFLLENLSFGNGTGLFASTAVNVVVTAVAVVAGTLATVANYRRR